MGNCVLTGRLEWSEFARGQYFNFCFAAEMEHFRKFASVYFRIPVRITYAFHSDMFILTSIPGGFWDRAV